LHARGGTYGFRPFLIRSNHIQIRFKDRVGASGDCATIVIGKTDRNNLKDSSICPERPSTGIIATFFAQPEGFVTEYTRPSNNSSSRNNLLILGKRMVGPPLNAVGAHTPRRISPYSFNRDYSSSPTV
jgi:hypothetical protein